MKLAVAGGFYRETCREPAWNDTFGPGGRAAAALSARGVALELHTYVSESQAQAASFFSATFDVEVHSSPIELPISFYYLHFLSVPQITPAPGKINRAVSLTLTNDAVLRFGFLEGDAVVHGRRVVYDPQDAFTPKPFRANGSTADELAIVANVAEARLLTGLRQAEEMASAILESERASVVVIKLGSGGSLVATKDGQQRVPAFPTPAVWKIGSGDVFSAEFAYAWAVEGKDPTAAAMQASLQTAYYCEYPTLPIRKGVSAGDLPVVARPTLPPTADRKYDAYLAGPFFNLAQQWQIEEAYHLLTVFGLRVFSPFHAVGDGQASVVAKADIEGLLQSRFVFACLDGFDPGTVFEVGYATAKNIPILGFGRELPESDLVMLKGTGCEIIKDFTSAIYRAAWWTAAQ